jgi:hypothetical protein
VSLRLVVEENRATTVRPASPYLREKTQRAYPRVLTTRWSSTSLAPTRLTELGKDSLALAATGARSRVHRLGTGLTGPQSIAPADGQGW